MIDTSKFNIKTVKQTKTYGKFEMSPLIGGFGHTLGIQDESFLSLFSVLSPKVKLMALTIFYHSSCIKEDLVEISLI